jgi:hypothetical protein
MTKYQSLVLSESSLLSYWKCDNDWFDAKGNNHFTSNGAFGEAIVGTASGNFSSTWAYAAHNENLNVSSYTFEVLANRTGADPAGPFGATIYLGDNGGSGHGLLYQKSTGKIIFMFAPASGVGAWLTSDNVMAANTTYYLAGTFDNTTKKCFFYVNGVEQTENATLTDIPWWNSNVNASIAQYAVGYNDYFNGLIDEAAIYSSALSPATILAHYNAIFYLPPTMYVKKVSTISKTNIVNINGLITSKNKKIDNIKI